MASLLTFKKYTDTPTCQPTYCSLSLPTWDTAPFLLSAFPFSPPLLLSPILCFLCYKISLKLLSGKLGNLLCAVLSRAPPGGVPLPPPCVPLGKFLSLSGTQPSGLWSGRAGMETFEGPCHSSDSGWDPHDPVSTWARLLGPGILGHAAPGFPVRWSPEGVALWLVSKTAGENRAFSATPFSRCVNVQFLLVPGRPGSWP